MNTYIINGTINYYIDKEVKKIIKDDNYVTFDLACNTLEDLINEASFSSMFDDKKNIIVKNSTVFFASSKDTDTDLAKKDSELLLSYLKDENKNVVLIFILNKKPDSKKKITKLIDVEGHIINIPRMTKTDMKNELSSIIKKEGYTIDSNDLWYIVNSCLNNFDIALSEVKKIMLYYNNPTHIESDTVSALLCNNVKENNFELIDSIIERKLSISLNNLVIIKTYKVDPIVIFMGIISEMRKTYYIMLLKRNGYNYNEILRFLQIADFQYEKYEKYLKLYNENELKESLLKLSDIDYILKSQNIDRELILYKYILETCE